MERSSYCCVRIARALTIGTGMLALAMPLPGYASDKAAAQFLAPTPPLRETGLRADHVVIKRGSDRVLESNRLSLDQNGLRMEQEFEGFRLTANYSEDRLWLADLSRGVQHEIPVTFVDRSEGPGSAESVVIGERGIEVDSGLLSSQACAGLVEISAFEATWRALPVTISECADGDLTPVVRHWFNSRIGLVIRTMDTQGRIEELRAIQSADLPDDYFSVDPDLREVDIAEFFTGAKPLQRYTPEVTALPSLSDHGRHDSPIFPGSSSQF